MTAQPVEANVVLTADNSQYDQAMMQSAGSTNQMGAAVDSLGKKINSLTKATGKGLVGIAATDVAMITAATAAWSQYEKQMSRLSAQAAVRGKTQTGEQKMMADYTKSVKTLRQEYGTSTTEAARLVETLSKMTDTKSTRRINDLGKVFTDMSVATGESSDGLASSLGNLQKVMGGEVSDKTTRKYADMFTTLAASTNTTAGSLIDFTSQLAPLGEQMGMSEKQIAGFATAFSQAGQEGFTAANVFTKISGDITKSIQTGSPEIKKYANLVGVTSKQFKEMDAGEQMLQVLEALQKMGPRASTELQRLGLDGTRSMRAITAVLNQPGGPRAALGLAEEGYNSNAASKGREAGMQGLSDDFAKLREEMKRTAEAMGTLVGPIVGAFVQGMTKVQRVITDIAEGPLGKFVQLIMAVVAPLASGAGAMLLFAGALLKVAAAFALWRNSASQGVREGMKGGAGITQGPDGRFIARGEGGRLGEQGANIAQKGSWFQRGMYNTGQPVGAALAGAGGFFKESWMQGRERWDPKYVRPTESRTMLSYAAGGLGRALDWGVTPQFDPIAQRNVAKRTPMLEQFSPWSKEGREVRRQRSEVRDLEAVQKDANAQLSRNKMEQVVAGTLDLGMDPQTRKLKQDQLKASEVEIKTRLEAARATQQTTQANIDQTIAARGLNRETGEASRGFRRLGEGLWGVGKATGRSVGGLGMMGGRALMGSHMAMPVAGMAGAAVLSATDTQSNMLMMGAMGGSLGPWGAAAGAVVGAGMDMAAANDAADERVKNLRKQADLTAKSGQGLAELSDEAAKTDESIADLDKSFKDADHEWFVSPTTYWGATKNKFEGVFGTSDIEELTRDSDKAQKTIGDTEQSLRDLAGASGVEIVGTRKNQLQQLADFGTGPGAAMLAKAGIDLESLAGSRGRGKEGYDALIGAISTPIAPGSDMDTRMRGTMVGRSMLNNPMAQEAMQNVGDIGLQYKATADVYRSMRNKGKSNLQILIGTEKTQAEIGTTNEQAYDFTEGISQQARQNVGMQMSQMGRADAFQAQVSLMRGLTQTTPQTPEDRQQLTEEKGRTAGAIADQVGYFKQLLLAQDQYELNRRRSQDAYHLQRTYQEYDYNLQRSRAEESFNRQRNRATADYHRGVRRANHDYQLQRRRQEEDFNHQVEVMSKQAATTVYNIYDRVQTQRTHSASWILSNAGDQLARMQEQASTLDDLRKRGLSDNVIQQMKLTDPQNAQQLASLATELTPQMIRQFNKVAGTERVKAAKEIVTDPSSLEWQEMRRGYRRARRQGAEDFERQMKISRQDFKRGLGQMDEDFKIMMDEQAADHITQTNRQEHQYKLTMDQAAEDMANMANEINLSMEEVLVQSTKRLSGSAQTQAASVLKSFQDLKKDTTPEAVAMMQELADIFGFEYKTPKKARETMAEVRQDAAESKRRGMDLNRHEGGTIPGWTPGRDPYTVNVSGGEAVMRPEWARAVGEKAIDAMNHKAKHGGFAAGGVFWPVPGHQTGTYPGHDGVDINRGSGSDDYGDPIRAFRSGTITYVGTGHGYGEAIFEKTAAGTVVYGHTSSQRVHSGQHVNAGQLIGQVGSTGNSSAPHLHFGIPGGTTAQALALLQGAMMTGITFAGGALAGSGASPHALLKSWYPKSERGAYDMKGAHPLDPGMITQVINRYARRKIRKLGGIAQEAGIGALGAGAGLGMQPSEHMDNERLVHIGANRYGWGDQWSQLRQLVMHESGFRNTAQNPDSTAYGMFQFLDETWGDYGFRKTSDPWKQTQAGLKRIKSRYHDPRGAWDFWKEHNWYKDGSVFNGAQTIGVGENGPEAVIPLNERGANFMTDVMGSVMGGRNVTQMRGGASIYNTRIDRSTNFSGPITIQANDPHEMITKLRARQRVMALSRPSLTGSAA